MADDTMQDQPQQPAPVLGLNDAQAASVSQANAKAEADAAALELDETVPGGAYRVGDSWVDANGNPIKAPKGQK